MQEIMQPTVTSAETHHAIETLEPCTYHAICMSCISPAREALVEPFVHSRQNAPSWLTQIKHACTESVQVPEEGAPGPSHKQQFQTMTES